MQIEYLWMSLCSFFSKMRKHSLNIHTLQDSENIPIQFFNEKAKK
ncbi:hypothetical protein D1BOALGB6SA_5660 [Olavius sp. associated proteobacterium Delta 1]|nr:hypothetical protein D1BOALGB6SA_5660 [Olavius sp. associated proteobacterium Delta 1]